MIIDIGVSVGRPRRWNTPVVLNGHVCTVVVSIEPDSAMPVIVLAVRDEFLGRPWLPPARHWPDYPALVGGLDRQAGGTWLAMDPGAPRVSCVLNGRGRPAGEPRRSRGVLPLLGAQGLALPGELANVDPFHLVTADLGGARLASWDGERFTETALSHGTTVIVNSGVDGGEPRAARLGRLLSHTERPSPRPGADPATAWGAWLELAAGVDVARTDPEALIMRHVVEDLVYGSSSVSLIALGPDGVRFDFAPVPDQPAPLVVSSI